MWSSKSQREQYFKEQRVLNVDSKIKKREDGKWPLYIDCSTFNGKGQI